MPMHVTRNVGEYRIAIAQMQAEIGRITASAIENAQQTFVQMGAEVLGESTNRAPIDTGNLRSGGYLTVNGQRMAQGQASGAISHATPDTSSAGKLEVVVGFSATGSPSANYPEGFNYAEYQHERIELHHPRGGQAKYLQSVFEEQSPTWAERLKAAIQEGIKRA